jgi:hypothetical protein
LKTSATFFCCSAVFNLLYNFIKNFTVLNVECFYYCIITVPAVYIHTRFTFTRYFYSLCNQVILVSVYTFTLYWKTSFKDVYKSMQQGVKLIVGIICIDRFPTFIF